MSYLAVNNLIHKYGEAVAIQDASFTVEPGQRLCLLGPSGCGKTTTLQAIAGFIKPHSGSISIDGNEIIGLPPEDRNIGIMFQNYALFPHMSVFDNVAFGLKMRKTPRSELINRVNEALKVVRLDHKASRLPSQLSGGEQQRIAFARAIVIRPRLLLLDEPFSNLDARLRLTMRNELLELLEGLEIATLMVTHDQEEAMAIGDRIAVMQAGKIQQIGTSRELYQNPNSLFVGEFLGESNLFSISACRSDAGKTKAIAEGLGEVVARSQSDNQHKLRHLLVRPEKIRLLPANELVSDEYPNRFSGIVEHIAFLGPRIEARVRVGERTIQIFSDRLPAELSPGDQVQLVWTAEESIFVEGNNE